MTTNLSLSDIPNVRASAIRSCGNCKFMTVVAGDYDHGNCTNFDAPVERDWVCDAWAVVDMTAPQVTTDEALNMAAHFVYAELSDATDKPFDGFSVGEFTDMNGTKRKFTEDELDEYLTNTQAAIDATKTESGAIVGLPIDAKGHDKSDAAGFMVGIERDGTRLRVKPEWNDIGRDVIGKRIRRWFSATVDTANKVILGGSLTNWPATRSANGRVLLRPIELSSNLFQIEESHMPTLAELSDGDRAALLQQAADAIKPELEQRYQNSVIELQAKAKEMAELEMTKIKTAQHIAEFSAAITGGTSAQPRGLSVKADDVSTLLAELSDDQRGKVETLLTNIVAGGVVDYTERGHNRTLNGMIELAKEIKPLLTQWLAAGKTTAEFFAANPELGGAGQYNLAEFEKETK